MTDSPSSSTDRETLYVEAIAQWTTRYHHPSGFDCQITLEAQSGVEALKKGEAAISHLIELKYQPVPFSNSNGVTQKAEISTPPPSTSGNPICPLHNVEMKEYRKGDCSWFSHRIQNGWCRGEQK